VNLLLDTHVLVWWLEASRRIGARTRRAIERSEASVWISAASVWEIAVKSASGRLELRDPFEDSIERLLDKGFQSLLINFAHAITAGRLPPLHSDPFDRMLVAQAQCENLTIVTVDSAIEAYGIRTLDASE
jgi:PIN domain nuclease of toxin-antitoxin system